MPDQNVRITVTAEDRASAPLKNVNSALGNLEKGASKVGGAFSSLASSAVSAAEILVANLATQAVNAVAGLTQEMIKLSLEQSKLESQTENLMKNAGMQSYSDAIGGIILQHEEMTAMDDAAIRRAFNNLLGSTKDYNRSLTLLSAAEELAAAKGISLEDASNQITSALEGSIVSLSKAGVELDAIKMKSMTAGQQMDYLAQQIEKSFGGSAEALRNSPSGIFANFRNQIDNLKKIFGDELTEALAPAWEDIATTISNMIDSGQLQPLIDSFGKLLVNAVELGQTLGSIIIKLTGVTTTEEGVTRLADGFDRLSYILEMIEDALSRIDAIIKDLKLDQIMSLGMRVVNPGGSALWDYAGNQVEEEKSMTPRLVQLDEVQKDNTKTTKANTDAQLEQINAQRRATQESQLMEKYLKLQEAATSSTAAITGQFGNAMSSAISSVQSALSSFGIGSSGRIGGGCRTFGSGSRIEDNHSSSDEPFPGNHFSTIPVPDALITKRGDIVKFHPEDNILAFKDPSALRGGKGNISVTINVNGAGDPDRIAEEIMKKITRLNRIGF